MRWLVAAWLSVALAQAATPAQIRQLIDSGQRTAARETATQWLAENPVGPVRAEALNSLAETWVTGKASDTQRVQQLTEEAQSLDPGQTESLLILARQFSRAGDNRKAGELIDQAISHGDNRFTTVLLKARFHSLRGDMEGARKIYQETVASVETSYGADSSEFAQTLTGYSNLLNSMSRYSEAKPLLEKAIAIGEHSPGPALADSLSTLAATYYHLGDFQKARDLSHRSTSLLVSDPAHNLTLLGYAYRIFGQSREALGDYDGAREELERAHQADEQLFGSDSIEVADDLNIEAITAANSGNYELARKRFADVVAIYEARLGMESDRTGGALTNLGQILITLHRYREAQASLQTALAIQIKATGADSNIVAQIYQKLGSAAIGMGNYAQARTFLENNIALWRARFVPTHPNLVNSLTILASALAHTADHHLALETSLEAARLRRQYVTDTMQTASEREALQIAGRNPSTLNVALALGAETPASTRAVWNELIHSRSLVLDEMAARYRAVRTAEDPALTALLQSVRQARSNLAKVALTARGTALTESRAAVQQAESTLATNSIPYRDRLRRAHAGFAEVAAALPIDGALVAYARFSRADAGSASGDAHYAYSAFVMTKAAVHLIALGDATPIEARVKALAREIAKERDSAGHGERRNEASYRAASALLRRSVWDPLKPYLAGAKQVFIVPDGSLQIVNFAAFPIGENNYLIDAGPVLRMLSAERDLVRTPYQTDAGVGLVALGSPRFSPTTTHLEACAPSFAPLPGSRLEAREVAALWKKLDRPAETLTDAQATEKALAAAVVGKGVVHLATHGFVLSESCQPGNPLLRSGLALSDGVLTAAQAAALNLEQADWVVLSGCDTGLGDLRTGEGVLGLRRAFQEAGARTVVASLWPIEDDSTRAWMSALYRYRFLRGLSTARAIQATDRAFLASRRVANQSTHPYYWAGFIAVERE